MISDITVLGRNEAIQVWHDYLVYSVCTCTLSYSVLQNTDHSTVIVRLHMCSVRLLSKMTSIEGQANPNPNHRQCRRQSVQRKSQCETQIKTWYVFIRIPKVLKCAQLRAGEGPLKVPQNPSNVLIAGTLRVYLLYLFFVLSLQPLQLSSSLSYTLHSTLYTTLEYSFN